MTALTPKPMSTPLTPKLPDLEDPFLTAERIWTLWIALGLGLLFLVVQFLICCYAPPFRGLRPYNFWILSLIGLTAGCAGWATGIFLSPLGSQVEGAQKVLAGFAIFWSGVVVSHLDQFRQGFAVLQRSTASASSEIRLTFAIGIYLYALCVTFNTRFWMNMGIDSTIPKG
jgi:hypothetical protein